MFVAHVVTKRELDGVACFADVPVRPGSSVPGAMNHAALGTLGLLLHQLLGRGEPPRKVAGGISHRVPLLSLGQTVPESERADAAPS